MKNLFETNINQDVDVSISMNECEKDSNGNKLTSAQSSYFKNSVIRDSSNRLQVCYHGSSNYFNVFDTAGTSHKPNRGIKMLLDFGTHFTEDKAFAKHYGGVIYEAYLDIKHPYVMTTLEAFEDDEPTMSELISKGYDGVVYCPIHKYELIIIEDEFDLYKQDYPNGIVTKLDRKDNLEGGQCWIRIEYLEDVVCYIVFDSNQIKRITNTTPTKSKNIDEARLVGQTQEEYFKNSKVRDDRGNLLICYHGTPNPGFKSFDARKAKSQFGDYKFNKSNVNYFTTNKASAESFTEFGYDDGTNVYACYINIVNPFVVDNKSLSDIKSSFNIKDDRIRKYQIDTFNDMWDRYSDLILDEDDYPKLNKYYFNKLGYTLKPVGDNCYDVLKKSNNSLYGNESSVLRDYTLTELFDSSMYDDVKEALIGDEDDYYLSTDDVVNYVLIQNEENNTNYDGVIIKDIFDSKSLFSGSGIDVITLKSSNQIKLISNLNPTDLDNVDEAYLQPDKGFYDIKGNEVTWNERGLDYIWWGSESTWNGKYAQSYRCKMSPKDFLDLTTSKGADALVKGDNIGGTNLDDLDIDRLNRENYQDIYLLISFDKHSKKTLDANRLTKNFNAKVIGHEGRHRMFALWQRGVTSVDVEIKVSGETKYDRYNPFEIDNLELVGQFNPRRKVIVKHPIPMSWEQHKIANPNAEKNRIDEEYLVEVSRRQLIDKSKKSDRYKDTSKGKNRWERKKLSKIATSVSQYNNINMDAFFKKDVLTVGINVHGETDNYVIVMKFEKMLENIQREIKRNNNKLEFKIILVALTNAFNNGNVYVHCTCPDYTYRGNYWATVNGYEASTPQTSNGKRIQNPNDTKGAGCKHVMLVLSNVNWIMKVASVINNYIKYAEEHMQKAYADIIFPKLYGMKYDRAVQLGLFDSDDLDTSKQTIDIANKIGKNRGKFSTKNQPIRNKGNQQTQSNVVGTNKKELNTSIDDEEETK